MLGLGASGGQRAQGAANPQQRGPMAPNQETHNRYVLLVFHYT